MLVCDVIPPRVPDPRDPWLCLVLHGLGDTKEGWKPVAPMLHLDRMGFAFAQAPIPYYGGWSWFDIALDGPVRINEAQVRSGRALIDKLVTSLLERQRLPAHRLFVLGFSQGCVMALDWGLRHRERLAGIIGISGSVAMVDDYPAAFGVTAPTQALLMTHGIHDAVLPIVATRERKDRLISHGATLEWREYRKDHGLDPEDELPDLTRWMSERMRRAKALPSG